MLVYVQLIPSVEWITSLNRWSLLDSQGYKIFLLLGYLMVILDKILKKREWDIGGYLEKNFSLYHISWTIEPLTTLFHFISLEVEMIQKAHKMGLLTTPYAFNQYEAIEMAKVGADIIVAHMGLTTTGSIGAKTSVSLKESVVHVQAIADAAHRINPGVIVLCHGGMKVTSKPLCMFILRLNSKLSVH